MFKNTQNKKGKNIMEKVIGFIVFMLVITMIYRAIMGKNSYDDSDNYKKRDRSGLIVYTDYGTGNQYISTLFDFTGHKPRLDKDGKQINIFYNPVEFKN